MTEPKTIAKVAAIAHLLRPDWPERSIRTYLDVNHNQRPGYQLLVAAVACYGDPATATPARLGENGPWWRAAHAATAEAEQPSQPPRFLPGIDDAVKPDADTAHRGAAACRAQLGDTTHADAAKLDRRLARLLRDIRDLAPALDATRRDRLCRACYALTDREAS